MNQNTLKTKATGPLTLQLSDKIKELCKERHKTIKDLATDIEMTEVGFHQSLQRCSLKVSALEKVAAVLDVDITYFFKDKKESETKHGKKK